MIALPPDVTLAERIGEGGLADVFRGTWRGREVALKILREPDRSGLRKRFVREGQLLQRLSHPGLVRCFAVLDAEQPVLVLELLKGDALDVHVYRRGPVPPDECVGLASSLLRTLGYLHHHGIVHRDVKASNVWLGDDNRVVLLDLGLAADVDDPLTTTLGDVLGTHAYMAPEQIAGAECDHRCDLYSLGITLYEALCGQRPYRGSGLASYLEAHRAAGATPIVERVPGVPVRLATLVDRLMARDPAARPASAAVALALLTGGTGLRLELAPPPLVGRQAATGAIQAVLDGGGVLRICGELGSGIGAVARHALKLAREDGIEHAAIRSRPRLGVPEMVAALAREVEAVVGELPSDLDGVLSGFEALVGEDGRFLVVVEDLDLAPEGVPDLVWRLAEVPGLALVVTGRTFPAGALGREIALRPLEDDEVRTVVEGMLGTPRLPPGLDAAVARASGGLPAVVVAVLREQVSRGAIWCDGMAEDGSPRWVWDPAAPLTPGEDTTRLFDRALRTLPDATRWLVQALAVAGEPVPLDLLLAAGGIDASGAELGPALRQGLVALRLVRGEEWVSLRRAVLEPILVNALSEDTCRAIHLQLADAARQRGMREWEQRFLLLHLALGAREPEDTRRLVELGDWLVATGRAMQGLEVLDAAVGLPTDHVGTVACLALARCDALLHLGRLPEARLALDAGRAFADAAGEPDMVARAALAHLDLALLLAHAGPDEAWAVLDEPPSRLRARAMLAEGALRERGGDLEGAEAAWRGAIERAAPGPVDRVGVAARIAAAGAVAARGDPARAASLFRALAAELRAVERPLAGSEALVGLASALLAQGKAAAARDALRSAAELIGDRPAPWHVASVRVAQAELALALGADEIAAGILDSNGTCGDPVAPWPLRRRWIAARAEQRAAAGDAPAALEAHLRGSEAAAAGPDRVARAFHSGMVGVLTASAGPLGAAVDELSAYGAQGRLARLLLAGAIVGRDAEILAAAEESARTAGDVPLLLRILHARRDPAGRPEARALCNGMLEGLYGDLRAAFQAWAPARWAFGH